VTISRPSVGRTRGGELDRLFLGGGFENRVAASHFLALRERAVGDGDLAAGDSDACACRRGPEPAGFDKHAGLGCLGTQCRDGLGPLGRE
jgi:hypothetical protein